LEIGENFGLFFVRGRGVVEFARGLEKPIRKAEVGTLWKLEQNREEMESIQGNLRPTKEQECFNINATN
jgi:hypothetical protein